MIRALIPWRLLTKYGIPPLKVARRPLEVGEVVVPVGEAFDPELFPLGLRNQRLRQYYEQHRLEPVNAVEPRKFYLDQRLRHGQGMEAPITPVTPVASRIVADLPAVPVTPYKPVQKGGRR